MFKAFSFVNLDDKLITVLGVANFLFGVSDVASVGENTLKTRLSSSDDTHTRACNPASDAS